MRRDTFISMEMWSVDQLFRRLDRGELGLPNFQRRFEWTVSDVKAYLSTVLAGLPSGTLMIVGNDHLGMPLRPIDGAPPVDNGALAEVQVLLDGQQRVTTLYQAAYDLAPEKYFVDFSALARGADLLQDDVIVALTARQQQRGSSANEARSLVPVSALLDSSSFFSLLFDATDAVGGELSSNELEEVFSRKILPLTQYSLPVSRIDGEVDFPTVAQIFERTNKWGQRLDSFDLLVARLQAGGWQLRDAWDAARSEHPEIDRVFGDDGLASLSAISLIENFDVRRSSVLSLDAKQVERFWDRTVDATARVSQLLLAEGVRQPGLLPYQSVAVAMIAAVLLDSAPDNLLRTYFWLACANRRYEVASNTTVVADFRALSEGSLGELGQLWNLTEKDVGRNTRRSSRALYSTLVALMLSRDPLDLVTAMPVSSSDPNEDETWRLTSFVKGGGDFETESAVPSRLRTASQVFSGRGRGTHLQRAGLRAVVEQRGYELGLFASIDACLDSQTMPPSDFIIATSNPRDIVSARASLLYTALDRKARPWRSR